LFLCLLVSSGGAFIAAKHLQWVFKRFTAYMLTSRTDAVAGEMMTGPDADPED
jgi:hypothetical protein